MRDGRQGLPSGEDAKLRGQSALGRQGGGSAEERTLPWKEPIRSLPLLMR